MTRAIDAYFWPTPNGQKVTIALEEMAIPYELHPVNIGRGDQFGPALLRISPNNRMPAIVDHQPADGGEPLSVFESGAILIYLAEKSGRFLPRDDRPRVDVLQWVIWQAAGLAPMAGQLAHFLVYAPERIPYALDRYTKEVNRLFGVLERRLQGRDHLCGDYSIADMMSWPWVVPWKRLGQELDEFPAVRAWFDRVGARPAVQRGLEAGRHLRTTTEPDEEAKRLLVGQTARSVKDAEAARR